MTAYMLPGGFMWWNVSFIYP